MSYKGGCHCGRIAFEVDGEIQELMECNCSICSKRGYLHFFVPRDKLVRSSGKFPTLATRGPLTVGRASLRREL